MFSIAQIAAKREICKLTMVISKKAVAIDTNSLVALRATNLLLTPTLSRDYIIDFPPLSIL